MEESRRENAKLVETVTQLKAENAEFNNLKTELQARIEELESAVNSVPVTVENGTAAEPVTVEHALVESASIESASIENANTEITISEVDEGTVCGKTYKELEDENISMRNFIDRLKSEHASIFDQLQGTLSEKDQELIKQREQVQSLTRANQQRIKQMLRVINALKQMEKEVTN
jgi:chromosome segregation ATPase